MYFNKKFIQEIQYLKKIMIISVYFAILFDSQKTITNSKWFFYVYSFFEGSTYSSKNYNISLELVKKNTFFEKDEINFGNNS